MSIRGHEMETGWGESGVSNRKCAVGRRMEWGRLPLLGCKPLFVQLAFRGHFFIMTTVVLARMYGYSVGTDRPHGAKCLPELVG